MRKPKRYNRNLEERHAIENSLADDVDEPTQDPSLGDKTPAYVEWLRDNDKEKFIKTYKGRVTHLGRIGENYYER